MEVNLFKISEEIAHDLGAPLDHALKIKIRSVIKEQRVFHIRRSFANNRSLSPEFMQTFFTPITTRNIGVPYKSSSYECTARTLEVIPSPIRIDIDSPFQDITGQDGSVSFAYTKLSSLKFNGITMCTRNVPRYIYINGHIYTYFNKEAIVPIQGLLITGLFEDPTQIRDYNNDANYYEMNYPMPYDLVNDIKQYIRQSMIATRHSLTNVQPDNKDITLNGFEQ